MQKQINVCLERNDDKVYLSFGFDEPIKLELSSEKQEDVKAFFQKLLSVAFSSYLDNQVEYIFDFLDEQEDLFHDVAKKYISNLNSEMQAIYSNLKTKFQS